jgi:hypothetical protein
MAEVRVRMVLFCAVCVKWTIHSRPQHKPNDKFRCDTCAKFLKDNIKSVSVSPSFKGA